MAIWLVFVAWAELMLFSMADERPNGDRLALEAGGERKEAIPREHKEDLEEIELEWVELPSEDVHVELPRVEDLPRTEAQEKVRAQERVPEPKEQPVPPDPPKLAEVEPPPPMPVPVPVAPPPPKEVAPVEVIPKLDRRKAVEVDDDANVVEELQEDARYLSDKNRKVSEETRATETNLEKEAKGEHTASLESEDQESPEVGGPEENIAQLEESQATTIDAKRKELASARSGRADRAAGLNGSRESQDTSESKIPGKSGALSMRDIAGRGSPGAGMSLEDPPGDGLFEVARSSRPGEGGNRSLKTRPKLKLNLGDYERIVGVDHAREESELARRTLSHRKGKWDKKLSAIRSSLENFIPEVKPGNQNALGTRASPFALYLAKMHRQIHELWGFGFLEDLDAKPSSDPRNDLSLKITMEIVLFPDGTVDHVMIARPSGVLTFDVAAVDTVMSAGPFGETPAVIRSANGKVYMHWTFHRNEYQCSNQFADPFILDNPPSGADAMTRGMPEITVPRRPRPERLNRTGTSQNGDINLTHVRRVEGLKGGELSSSSERSLSEGPENYPLSSETNKRSSKRSNKRSMSHEPEEHPLSSETNGSPLPSSPPRQLLPSDPEAEGLALIWANAFEKGNIAELVKVSDVPFHSGAVIVANDEDGISAVWRNVLAEVPNRRIREWKLLSPAGYRAAFGHLPQGAEDGTPVLLLVVRLTGDTYTMPVVRKSDGRYRIIGLVL